MSKEKELVQKAEQLYIYSLPLIVSEMVHRDYSDTDITHDRDYPTKETAKFGRPNRDTLYSAGFVQLADSPYELIIPKVEDRYFLFPFFSPYGDVVDSLGTKSGKFGKFLLVQEEKEIPEGYGDYEILKFKESLIGYLMRVETKGEADYSHVHKIQDQVVLRPVYKDRIRKNDPKPEHIDPVVYAKSLSDKEYFTLFAKLLADNPALTEDTYKDFESFGYDRKNESFDYDGLDSKHVEALSQGRKNAEAKLTTNDLSNFKISYDGTWVAVLGGMGSYGQDHIGRARVMGSPGGWGANVPSECIYFDAQMSTDKKPLLADKNYKVHFEKDGLPHAGAFWSLAVYGADTGDVTAAENRIYSLNSNDLSLGKLKTNPDGSLDIYFGPDAPENEFIDNWIESKYPNDSRVSLNIRVYIPDEDTQKGLWVTPNIYEI